MRLQDGVSGDKNQEELVQGGEGINKLVQQFPGRQLPVKAARLRVEEPLVERLRPRARVANHARVFDHHGRRRGEGFRPPRVVVAAERPREAVAELVRAGGGKREASTRDAAVQRPPLPVASHMGRWVPHREPGATGGGVATVSGRGPRRVVVGGVPIDVFGVVLIFVFVVNGEDRLTCVPGRVSSGRLSAAATTRGQVAGRRRGGAGRNCRHRRRPRRLRPPPLPPRVPPRLLPPPPPHSHLRRCFAHTVWCWGARHQKPPKLQKLGPWKGASTTKGQNTTSTTRHSSPIRLEGRRGTE